MNEMKEKSKESPNRRKEGRKESRREQMTGGRRLQRAEGFSSCRSD